MPLYRLQISLQNTTALPRDQFVNSVYVHQPAVMTDADFNTGFLSVVQGFYGPAIQQYLSTAIATGPHSLKAYTVRAPKETPPLHEGLFSIAPPGGTQPMPNEVACCLSFHADNQPGVIRQSWRGRIYLGPFNNGAASAVGVNGGRPDGSFINDLSHKGEIFVEDLNGISGSKACVYSRKLQMAYPIAIVSVDDEWDTQRSRGRRPTQNVQNTVSGGGGAGFAVV